MKKSNLKTKAQENGFELNWFYRVTTKPWFLLKFYIILSLIYSLIYGFINYIGEERNIIEYVSVAFQSIFQIFPLALILMPFGLFYFIFLFTGYKLSELSWLGRFYIISYFGVLAISIFNAIANKYEGKKLSRWVIITLMSLFLLSFAGCVIGSITGTDYTGWHP